MTAINDLPPDLQTALAQGKALEQSRQHQQARALYQALLAGPPSPAPQHAAQLHFATGRCSRAMDDPQTALPHFEAAHAQAPGNRPWQLALAQTLFILGRIGAAQSHYQALAATRPDDADALAGLGRCARKSGALAQALAHFRAAAAAQPDAPQHLLDIAEAERGLNLLDEAAASYRQYLQRANAPAAHTAHTGMGYVLRSQGQRREAASHFAQAAALQPGNPNLALEAATEQRETRQFDAARASAQSVLGKTPGHLAALLNLAETERAAGNMPAALGVLELALAIAPREPQSLLRAAHCLRALQRLDEARDMYHRALAEQPGNGWAYVGLGQTAKRQGRLDEAQASFAQALTLQPDTPALRLDLASEQRELGRWDEARALARHVLATDPGHIRALTSLAETEQAAGQYEASFASFAQAQALRPADPEILVKMAAAARQAGRQDEYDHHLEAALQLDPQSVPVIRSLAEHYLRAENPEAALELLQAAAAKNPGDTALKLTMLDALTAAGTPQAALALMDELEKSAPQPIIVIKRVHLLRRLGLYHESLAAARQATALYPYHITAWFERFQTEILISPDADVASLLDRAPAVTPHEIAQAARCRGAFAERQWLYADAAAAYQSAAALHPENSSVIFDLARIGLVTMELDHARTHLQKHRDVDAPNLRLRGKSLNMSQTLYGQLLDEYSLNDTPPRIRPQLSLPLGERHAALLPIAQAEPDNTAAAVTLTLALRQAGRLASITNPGGTPIPKLIFQFWDSADIPEDIALYRSSWRTHNPDYAAHPLNDASAQAFLQASYPPQVIHAYRQALEAAQKADLLRLALLFAYGGVYADADDRCQRPLSELLPPGAALVLYQEDLGTIGNNFIAAAPRHPLILQALQSGVQALNRGDADITWLSTGPGMLTRAFAQCYARGEQALPGHTLILGRHQLCPTVAIHCHCAYKKTKAHWTNSTFTRKRDARTG